MIVMAILGRKASAAVEAGRKQLRGTDADLLRVEAALRARLGADVLPPDDAAPSTSRGIASRFVSPVIGVCVVGGALFFAFRPGATPNAQPKAVNAQPPTAAVPSATIAAPPSAEPNRPAKSTPELASSVRSAVSTGSGAPRSERDPLAQEVALLSRATTALNHGSIGEALRALDEHQRLFPNGVLSEERRAALAQVLCTSGRVTEGRVQLARVSPNFPAGKRAKQICDSASTPQVRVKTD